MILFLPEIFIAITLAGVVLSEVGYHGEKVRLITMTSLIGLAGAFLQTLVNYQNGPTRFLGDVLVIDGYSLFFKLFFIVLAVLAILTSSFSKEIRKDQRAEFCALILGSTLAMFLISAAADLLLAFLALQFLNLMSYFLSAQSKNNMLSTEASFKHLAFGVFSGTLLLYGVALLFAGTHSLNIYEMHKAVLAGAIPQSTSLVVFILMFLALGFQIGAFPMHLWVADVLEGSPTPASAFLSVGTRAAGFSILVRFLMVVFAQPALSPGLWEPLGGIDWPHIVALLSGLTMFTGALMAFRQKAAKRMVAWLVVAQTGCLLQGVLVLDEVGISALLFNLVVDLFALTGVFYMLSFLIDIVKSDQLEKLQGMLAKAVPECICLVMFLACLVGIPPFPGFIGKFILIGVAIRHDWYFLAALSIFSTAVSILAVGRLTYALMNGFKLSTESATPASEVAVSVLGHRALLAGLIVPMFLITIFADWVLYWGGQSIQFILW